MKRIKIISTPPGSAPEEIRKQWVGVEIPLLSEEDAKRLGRTIRFDFSNVDGYEVSIDSAIKALREAGKAEASDYWEGIKSMLGVGLIFRKECCEELIDSQESGVTAKDEFEERNELINSMLDKIYPFEKGMDERTKERIDNDRQMLVLNAGWGSLSIEELRSKAKGEKAGKS